MLPQCNVGDEIMLRHSTLGEKMGHNTQEFLSSTSTTIFMETIFYVKVQNWGLGYLVLFKSKSQFHI